MWGLKRGGRLGGLGGGEGERVELDDYIASIAKGVWNFSGRNFFVLL